MKRHALSLEERAKDDAEVMLGALRLARLGRHQLEAIDMNMNVARFEDQMRQELSNVEMYGEFHNRHRLRFTMYEGYLLDGIRRGLHVHPPSEYLLHVCDLFHLTLEELMSGKALADKLRVYEARERYYRDPVYM